MATTSATLSSTSLSGLGLTGLSSGLDTSSIVSKLMAIESQPQTALKTQLTTLQTHTSAMQSLNTAIAAIGTTAKSALATNALASFTATSSSTAASATASSSASAQSLQFTVDQLAQTQVSVTGAMADTSSFASSDHSITIQVGSAAGVKVTAASSSVDDMISAINGAGAGVSASKVAAGTTNGVTQYRIQLTATASGAAAGFSVFTGDSTAASAQLGASSSPSLTTVTAAQDAQVTLYPGTAAAQAVTSSSNKFSSLSAGLDVTVSATSTSPVTINVAADSTAASTSAQALTSALIQVFSGIAAGSAITTSSSTSGGTSTSSTSGSVFTGDSLIRTVKDSLLAAATDSYNGKSISTIGINLTKDGTITFDQNAFAAAMASDPAGTTSMYQAVAQRVSNAASTASDAYSGSISQAVTSETGTQSALTTQISNWDTRLAAIQAQYTAQFNAMELALNNLSSQSSYLTSQITGLTSNYQTVK